MIGNSLEMDLVFKIYMQFLVLKNDMPWILCLSTNDLVEILCEIFICHDLCKEILICECISFGFKRMESLGVYLDIIVVITM